MDFEIIKELCSIFNKPLETIDDIYKIELTMEEMKETDKVDKMIELNKKIKNKYKSNSLTCLHSNSLDKQKFPGINYLRQILRCNGLKLKGRYISAGYIKGTGRKILKRVYTILD